MKKKAKQRNQIKIIKNKEIIIYKDGKKFKHFKRCETKKLNENEMYILDYLLNKYMGNEVDIESNNYKNYKSKDNYYNSELSSKENYSNSYIQKKKLIQSHEFENELDSSNEEKIISTNMKIKNKSNKKKSNQIYKYGEDMEEYNKNILNYSKKEKNKNIELSNELNEEEKEEENEEKSLDSDLYKQIKGRKNQNSDESDENGEINEENIKKRIIKNYKEQNNKITKKSITRVTHGDVVEIKQDKKQSKTFQAKMNNQEKKIKNEYEQCEENEEFEVKEKNAYKNQEPVPQYISQLKSYTSPTIKYLNEQKAEQSLLNGIPSSIFFNEKEIKGILFLSKNNYLCFISSEDDGGNKDIILDEIKKIYFNVSGSLNIKNYEKQKDEEKYIQLVEINGKINDIKFNNQEDYEFFIKGLIQIYKNKTVGIDKNLISHIVRNSLNNNSYKPIENIIQKNISANQENYNKYKYNNIRKGKNDYDNLEEIEYREYNNIEKNEINYNKNNKKEAKKENDEEDIIITTTITEVFKDGELINKETREKIDGVMKSLHVYSPDKDEYEVFLKNTKLGKNQMIKRYNDGLPLEENKDNDCSKNILYNIENDHVNEILAEEEN